MDVKSDLKLTMYTDKKVMMNDVALSGLFSWADLKKFVLGEVTTDETEDNVLKEVLVCESDWTEM